MRLHQITVKLENQSFYAVRATSKQYQLFIVALSEGIYTFTSIAGFTDWCQEYMGETPDYEWGEYLEETANNTRKDN